LTDTKQIEEEKMMTNLNPARTTERKRTIPFINGNDAPFGSFQRKMNIEVYKHDEDVHLVTLPIFFPNVFSGMKIRKRYHYEADFDGNITKRRIKFEYITKDGIVHMWGMKMLIFSVKRNFKAWRYLCENPNSTTYRRELKHSVERSDWPKAEWWRKVSGKLAALFLYLSPDSHPPKAAEIS